MPSRPADLDEPRPPPREIDKAKVRYWGVKLAFLIILGPIYVGIIADGLARVMPVGKQLAFGLSASKVLALVFMLGAFIMWEYALCALLKVDAAFAEWGDPEAAKKFILIVGGVVLVADTCLFYASVSRFGWKGVTLNFGALLSTAVYLTVIVFAAFVCVCLKKPILEDRS